MTRKGGRRPPPRVHEGEPIVAEPARPRDAGAEEVEASAPDADERAAAEVVEASEAGDADAGARAAGEAGEADARVAAEASEADVSERAAGDVSEASVESDVGERAALADREAQEVEAPHGAAEADLGEAVEGEVVPEPLVEGGEPVIAGGEAASGAGSGSAARDETGTAGGETPEGAADSLAGSGSAASDESGTSAEAPDGASAEEAAPSDMPGEAADGASAASGDEAPANGETVASDMPGEAADAEPAPASRAVPGVVLSDELPIDPDDDLRGVEGEASPRLVSILESLLFSAAKPMSVKDVRKVLAETSQHQIKLGLRHLMEATRSRGIVLAQVAGGFQFRTHPDNAIWVQKMLQAKPARLSRTQIETLAIIAYRQPITRPEIDDIRGVDSGAVLKSLLEREMIQIVGKKEEPGRPLLYGTTVRFLEFFNLRSLRDLPTLRDFRDLSEESKATLREKLGDLQIAEALGQEVLGLPEGQGETNMTEGAGEAGDAAPEDAPDAAAPPDEPDPGEEGSEAGGHADRAETAPEAESEPGPSAVESAEEVDGAAGLVAHDEEPRDALPIDGVDPVVPPEDMTVDPSQVVPGGAAAQDDEVVEVELPVESLPIAGDPSPADALGVEIVVSTGELVEAVEPAPEEFVAELAALVQRTVNEGDGADSTLMEGDGADSTFMEGDGGDATERAEPTFSEGDAGDATERVESTFDEGDAGDATERAETDEASIFDEGDGGDTTERAESDEASTFSEADVGDATKLTEPRHEAGSDEASSERDVTDVNLTAQGDMTDADDRPEESSDSSERDVTDAPTDSAEDADDRSDPLSDSSERDVTDAQEDPDPTQDAGERSDAPKPAPGEGAGDAAPPLASNGEEPQDAAPGRRPTDERDSTE